MEDYREDDGKIKDVLKETDLNLTIAHFSQWVPGLSGLSNASFDLVNVEKRAGLNSLLLDAYTPTPVDLLEDEIKCSPWEEAKKADVWVLHKMIPQELINWNKKQKKQIPIIVVLHGTVQDMFMQNFIDDSGTDWWNLQVNLINEYDAAVCVSPFDYQVNKLYAKDQTKLYYIREAVDPKKYKPEGTKMDFRFHPALILKDTIRAHKYPFFHIWSMPEVIKKIPTARMSVFCLHLVDMCKWRNFFLRSNVEENLRGTVELLSMIGFFDIVPFIRGSDITINSDYLGNQSRTAPESMMCGKPVIASGNQDYTPYTFNYGDPQSFVEAIDKCWNDLLNDSEKVKEKCLEFASKNFNLEVTLPKWIDLYKRVLN